MCEWCTKKLPMSWMINLLTSICAEDFCEHIFRRHITLIQLETDTSCFISHTEHLKCMLCVCACARYLRPTCSAFFPPQPSQWKMSSRVTYFLTGEHLYLFAGVNKWLASSDDLSVRKSRLGCLRAFQSHGVDLSEACPAPTWCLFTPIADLNHQVVY